MGERISDAMVCTRKSVVWEHPNSGVISLARFSSGYHESFPLGNISRS
jgi:hypothetical protein